MFKFSPGSITHVLNTDGTNRLLPVDKNVQDFVNAGGESRGNMTTPFCDPSGPSSSSGSNSNQENSSNGAPEKSDNDAPENNGKSARRLALAVGIPLGLLFLISTTVAIVLGIKLAAPKRQLTVQRASVGEPESRPKTPMAEASIPEPELQGDRVYFEMGPGAQRTL